MSKQNYYLGQGPWYIIKQYLGLRPGYCYKEFMNLELEVLQNIWYKKAGKAMNLDPPSAYCKPTPYQFQKLLWDNTGVEHQIENVQALTCGSRTRKVRGAGTLRNYNKELTRQYYKKHYPEFLATMDAMDSVLEKDKNLTSVAFDSIKSLKIELGLGPEIGELTRAATLDATQAAVEVHNKFSVMKKAILAACVQNPLRLDIYKALDRAVRRRYRLCACGCTVPTSDKAFKKHLKSKNHCNKVLVNCSAASIEAWYKCAGTLPPGFTRIAENEFSHIIPDLQISMWHGVLHAIRNRGSGDLGPCLSQSSWARGRYVVRHIVHN